MKGIEGHGRAWGSAMRSLLAIGFSAIGLLFVFGATSASAAPKQAIAYFGTESGSGGSGGQFKFPADSAVNSTGAGPGDKGDIYVLDTGNNRIQRFAQNDSGTSSNPYDDKYEFIAAWGAGVETTGSGYQICTSPSGCRAAEESGGNGTVGGDGALSNPGGIAIDQDTGNVYVADGGNFRINVYTGDGTFLRSFGWDVVESGPGNTGTSYEVCVAADGDVCKRGLSGSGVGQLGGFLEPGVHFGLPPGVAVSPPDGNPTTGTVYVADISNRRVDMYSLEGASPSSFGSATNFDNGPQSVAVDSRGIVYATDYSRHLEVLRYDSLNANGSGIGFLAPIDSPLSEVQTVQVNATAGQFKLSFGGKTTNDIAFDSDPDIVKSELQALSSIGTGNVVVNGGKTFYFVEFIGSLAGQDVEQITASNGTIPLSGSVTVKTQTPGKPGPVLSGGAISNMFVDPDSDGPGADKDTLYILRNAFTGRTVVQQFGPVNEPGLVTPPSADDEEHGATVGLQQAVGLGIDESTGRLFLSSYTATNSEPAKSGVYVLDQAGGTASVDLESLSDATATSVVLHGNVNPNGPPDAGYHAEYSLDGTQWTVDPNSAATVGSQESPQSVTATLNPPVGLEPNTLYHVRLVATRPFNPPVPSNELTFTTAVAPPVAETTGSPVRTANTVRLEGRVDPSNSPATFHFEYGDQGPCDANPCTSTEPVSAGSGSIYELASARVSELEGDTTYDYRIVADNGNPGSPVFGEDMTVTTRVSDAPLSHGHLPGPPGSDRAYEQVSLPDTGGNPVPEGRAFSDDGDRAVYLTSGGNPSSPVGGFTSQFYAERTASGWKSVTVMPPRSELAGSQFQSPSGPGDLSSFALLNLTITGTERKIWRLFPDRPAEKLFDLTPPQEYRDWYVGSASSTRVVAQLRGGTLDPAYPAAAARDNIYDISSGTPKLASLLPGNTVSPCEVGSGHQGFGVGQEAGARSPGWISPDGKLLFFPGGCGNANLYMREFETGQTKMVSGPSLSGEECGAILLKSTANAVFFWTQTRLTADDSSPSSCGAGEVAGGDVYRYAIAGGGLDCVTCTDSGVDADVYPGFLDSPPGSAFANIAVAADGSRVYFQSPNKLLPGAPELPPGSRNGSLYRVDVGSGNLRLVAGPGVQAGDVASQGTAINRDGSVIAFRAGDAGLNPLGEGSDNGGKPQYYLYDDNDRSLTCVSCPADGSPAREAIDGSILSGGEPQVGANTTPLANDGTFAFSSTEALVRADQNTAGPGQNPGAGTDIYEWRDGRPLLVSDGLTNWPDGGPKINGVSPGGRDIFFTAATQYTPDALDGYRRLYDARIGGGFEFPVPPKPCPLEVCQGTPKGAPEEQASGTGSFAGPGNAQAQEAHGKKHKKKANKKAHHKRKSHKRDNNNGRAAR
jgi:hypothetical protein